MISASLSRSTHVTLTLAMAFGLALATRPALAQDSPEPTAEEVEIVRAMGAATQRALKGEVRAEAATRIADCENRWVLLPREDGLLTLAFVYIDAQMGFTVHIQGLVAEKGAGLERRPWPMEDKARLIARIPTNIAVRCLDPKELAPLSLVAEPDWLKHYADASPVGEHLTSWGSHYNHIGASAQALRFLEKAHEAGVTTHALMFELGFAYNALGRFDDAKRVLAPVVREHRPDPNVLGELAYAQMRLGDYERAIEWYEKAIDLLGNDAPARSMEFARNISAAYNALGKKRQSAQWMKRSEKYAETARAAE